MIDYSVDSLNLFIEIVSSHYVNYLGSIVSKIHFSCLQDNYQAIALKVKGSDRIRG